jgi:Ni2+-binding GTPase involved in maturation of urease and hydrogenase
MNWSYSGSHNDITYTTASVVVKLIEEVNEWFIKVNYNVNSQPFSMLVNLVELVLVCDSNGNNLTFKAASELISNDYIVVSNSVIADVTSIEYERFSGDVVKLNIEPADVFLSGTNSNGIGNTIANNFIIYNYKS